MESKDKDAAINELLEKAEAFTDLHDPESLRRSIFSRVGDIGTGLGRGVAVAHGESTEFDNVAIAIGISKVGIGAPDEEPIHILFLLVNAEGDCSGYLDALSTVTKLMRMQDVRNEVCRCATKEQIEAKFLQAVLNL